MGEMGDSDLDIPCSIFVIQAAEEKPISNIEQGMLKDEGTGSLSPSGEGTKRNARLAKREFRLSRRGGFL
ncbi:MAG: hypothetical protein ACI8QI_000829 [Limisphaerales bacterium]|jgi:hypothetical protein